MKAYQNTARTRQPPAYYYGQIQHVLAVTSLPSLDYLCYFPQAGRPLCVSVARNDAYIERLLALEAEFWVRLQEERAKRGILAAAVRRIDDSSRTPTNPG